MIDLTNAQRAANGLPPLKLNAMLHDSAMWYAQDMADNNYYNTDHSDRLSRDPGARIMAFGNTWAAYRENQAAGQPTPGDVVKAWMNSPGHLANLMATDIYEIGVGYSTSATSTYVKYWVQDFGRQPGVYPVIINHEAANTTSANVFLYIYGRGWAQEMRLSNDNRTWSDWEPFESIKSWTLAAGGGIRTVYVQLRSGATVLSADDTINLISAAAPASSRRPTPETSSMPSPTSGDQAQHFPEGLSAIRQAANAAGIIWGFIPAANPGTNRVPVSGRSGQPAGS